MISPRAKWHLQRIRRKFKVMAATVNASHKKTVQEAGQVATKAMMSCTPPGNSKMKPAEAIKALKERIREDFEGQGEEPFQDTDVQWRRFWDGAHGSFAIQAVIITSAASGRGRKQIKYPSPFRVFRGKVSQKKLEALRQSGRGAYAGDDLTKWMERHPLQYRYGTRGKRSNTIRLKHYGTRHITSLTAVKREIRRRQKDAGKLMAGWKALAAKSGAKLPAAVKRHPGNGSAAIRKSAAHHAVLEAHNFGNYPGLQRIVDRQIPFMKKKLKLLAKARSRHIAASLRRKTRSK